MPAPGDNLDAITVAMFAALNKLGMDPYKANWPKPEDVDFQTNHHDLPAFWRLDFSTPTI